MAEESSPEDIQKAVDAIYTYAGALLREGKSRSEVEDALVAKGIERGTATVVVDKLLAARAQAVTAGPAVDYRSTRDLKKEEGSRNIAIGAIICLVGIVITVGSYSMASSGSGGGRYMIAWGAIVWGAIRFFRGLSQSNG